MDKQQQNQHKPQQATLPMSKNLWTIYFPVLSCLFVIFKLKQLSLLKSKPVACLLIFSQIILLHISYNINIKHESQFFVWQTSFQGCLQKSCSMYIGCKASSWFHNVIRHYIFLKISQNFNRYCHCHSKHWHFLPLHHKWGSFWKLKPALLYH